VAYQVTLQGLSLMSLTATTAVTSTAEERCYNQPANVSNKRIFSGLARGFWPIPEGRLPARDQ